MFCFRSAMGHRRATASLPYWTATVGSMAEACRENPAFRVIAVCELCRRQKAVDLAELIAARGADYALIKRRVRCRLTTDCLGKVHFYYSQESLKPLWDADTARLWSMMDAAREERARNRAQILAQELMTLAAEKKYRGRR